MPGAIGRREVLRTARANAVLRRWKEVVGEFLSQRCWPDRYEQGVVYVAVEGSAWGQEVRMARDRILSRLADIAEDDTMFKDLRIGVRAWETPEDPIETPDGRAHRKAIERLSIREIAERRLGTWEDED